jgi:hypothetical protein
VDEHHGCFVLQEETLEINFLEGVEHTDDV